MKCPRCEHENRTDAEFCEKCGTPLTRSSGADAREASYADPTAAVGAALDREAAISDPLYATK